MDKVLTFARTPEEIATIRDAFLLLLNDEVPGFELDSRSRETMMPIVSALSFTLGVEGQEELVANLKSLQAHLFNHGVRLEDGSPIRLIADDY